MNALGIDMEAAESPGMMVMFLAWGFFYGVIAVWVYAAIRPRFGPGPRTALRAGLVVWLVGYLAPTAGYSAMGFWPDALGPYRLRSGAGRSPSGHGARRMAIQGSVKRRLRVAERGTTSRSKETSRHTDLIKPSCRWQSQGVDRAGRSSW